MTDLSRASVEQVDTQGLTGDVLDQPAQLGDALWRVESAELPREEAPGGLLVCGMGGSAIGGDLAAAAIGDRASRPIRVVRDYAPDPWTGPDQLVLCASYSGNTEETLACFEAAGAAGARRIALTTGGRLADAAREEGVTVVGVPAGFQPRAAVVYMLVGALECAAACGAAPSVRSELEAAAGLLGELAKEWGPDSADDSTAKRLAGHLVDSVPLFYGAGLTSPVARRWKTQANENAKAPSFWAELPELDHNELCGWESAKELAPLHAVFLEDREQHRRVRRRVELTAKIAEPGSTGVARLESRGESRVERLLSLVMLGDLVSIYLAVLLGRDPTPVEAIERFKQDLG